MSACVDRLFNSNQGSHNISSDLPTTADQRDPLIIPRPEHSVSRANISNAALKVLYRLRDAGFQAFLVGGAVRDLLLGMQPKDFDIATDASPEDVKRLFRNCRLIGRRFRLAHVYFGPEVIEVATFRAGASETDDIDGNDKDLQTGDGGRILRDNVYGSIDDDVWRRDFTSNSLYYNISDFSIWDYTGGVRDIGDRVLKMIGDPEQRYREDPVRMLRAVRFAAKLGFDVDPASEQPLTELGELLDGVPPARLFDESLKLFLSGYAKAAFDLLQRYDLFRHLLPQSGKAIDDDGSEGCFARLIAAALANTDERVAADKPVTPVFLFAVFLWEPARTVAGRLLENDNLGPVQSLQLACDEVIRTQQSSLSIPKRLGYPVRDILTMQARFTFRRGKRPLRLLAHPRFRAAYDLLVLRAAVGDVDPELAEWWTQIQKDTPREEILAAATSEGPPRRRNRRGGRRRNRPDANPAPGNS